MSFVCSVLERQCDVANLDTVLWNLELLTLASLLCYHLCSMTTAKLYCVHLLMFKLH